MPSYEAILFDFDGVLVDSEPVHWQCWQEVVAPYGVSVSWEEFAPNCIGVSERGTLEWLRNQRTPPVPFDELWAQYPRKKTLFRERMLKAGAVDSGVADLFQQLHEEYLLAVVTSSARSEVEPILDSAGLLSLIQTAVYGGDVTNLKPAPDPYRLASQRLGTRSALVVEDSPAGIASGEAAGFPVLRIPSQAEMVMLVLTQLGAAVPGQAPLHSGV